MCICCRCGWMVGVVGRAIRVQYLDAEEHGRGEQGTGDVAVV